MKSDICSIDLYLLSYSMTALFWTIAVLCILKSGNVMYTALPFLFTNALTSQGHILENKI